MFILTAKTTDGEVIRLKSNSHGISSHYRTAPVVRYCDDKGMSHVYESSLYTSKFNKLNIGDKLPVYYRTFDPEYAFAGSKWDLFIIEIGSFSFGAVLIMLGIYDYIRQ